MNSKIVRSVLGVILCLVMVGCVNADGAYVHSFAGRVVDADTGRSVSAAKVTVGLAGPRDPLTAENTAATTAADGSFECTATTPLAFDATRAAPPRPPVQSEVYVAVVNSDGSRPGSAAVSTAGRIRSNGRIDLGNIPIVRK